MRSVMYKLAGVVMFAAMSTLGMQSTATAAPTVGLQLQAMALEDCSAGCIRVEHPVFVTLSPAAGGHASYTGAVLIESERGGDTVRWTNLATGVSGSVTPNPGEPVMAETGTGAILFTAASTQQLWPGVGVLWVP